MPYGYASMLLLGEGSEATEPYNKYDKIRPHSIRSLQFDQKVRPLSFRPEKFVLFTATRTKTQNTCAFSRLQAEKLHNITVSRKDYTDRDMLQQLFRERIGKSLEHKHPAWFDDKTIIIKGDMKKDEAEFREALKS